MDSDTPRHKLSPTEKPTDKLAEPLSKLRDDPVQNPAQNVSGAANATKKIVGIRVGPSRGPHSAQAQKLVVIKGVFDILLSLSLILFPSLLYDGPITKAISYVTGLSRANWETDSSSAFALSSLLLGSGVAAISAGEFTSDDAYKVVAALHGVFGFMSLLGCLFRPHEFGSSFLFIAGLQDALWFSAIVQAGGYDVFDTLGLSWAKISQEADKLAEKAGERKSSNVTFEDVQGGVHGVESEGHRVKSFKHSKVFN